VANNDTIKKTVTVTLLLCIVCSVIVSTAAVMLKPAQIANKSLDFKRNILAAAGLLQEGVSVEEQFKSINTKLVDLSTGNYADASTVGGDLDKYDQQKAAKNPSLSTSLTGEQDVAKISSRENFSKVYLVEENGEIAKIILPIKGYGLWSTLYGFLALEADTNTIIGLGFYQHGETPGLGGEVDNPAWKALWTGKQVFAADGSIAIEITKGPAPAGDIHKVDGLSGATLTSKGVDNLVKFWVGENGFGPYLEKLKKGEA
jgi:Na+-transporting NADH:ubiquinone oxidoreductase subunit C